MSSSEDDQPAVTSTKRFKGSPVSFVTWNANGFISRCTWNKDQLEKLLRETNHPDVICLQEVRLKATSPTNRGTPLASDYNKSAVKEVLESTVFHNYHKFWSLSDTKYSGTLTLLHKRLGFSPQDAAFSTQSALSLLLNKFNLTRKDVGLDTTTTNNNNNNNDNNNNNAGNKTNDAAAASPKKRKQTTMKSFFAPKASGNTAAATTINNNKNPFCVSEHHPEGRFQFFCFPNFDLITTYSPNNGTKEESYQRRRDWDHNLKAFLTHRRSILEKAATNMNTNNSSQGQKSLTERPLLWCGDLNVARDYRDGTHWKRKHQKDNSVAASSSEDDDDDDGEVYEFWTDESQCFAAAQAKKLDPNRSQNDRGIPGFTPNERRRFAELLQSADMSDVWRDLHPNGVVDDEQGYENSNYSQKRQHYKSPWDRPNWTWRGHMSKDGNSYASKYQGKGQRLDYFLLSPSSLTAQIVERCDILGFGETREGLFCGSDHCATMLKLKTELL